MCGHRIPKTYLPTYSQHNISPPNTFTQRMRKRARIMFHVYVLLFRHEHFLVRSLCLFVGMCYFRFPDGLRKVRRESCCWWLVIARLGDVMKSYVNGFISRFVLRRRLPSSSSSPPDDTFLDTQYSGSLFFFSSLLTTFLLMRYNWWPSPPPELEAYRLYITVALATLISRGFVRL